MREAVDRIAHALLYEGYILYPYRRSATKNRQRWTFGGVYPPAWSRYQTGHDSCHMRTETLLEGDDPRVDVRVRFLQLLRVLDGSGEPWEEAIEREVELPQVRVSEMGSRPVAREFRFDGFESHQEDGRRVCEAVEGRVEVSAEPVTGEVVRFRCLVENTTPMEATAPERENALQRTMASTHTLLQCRDGAWVSMLEPPPHLSEYVEACANERTFPVLVGTRPHRDTMLSSPIILYDYPEVAPESPGDLFDSTEIDELLTLRVLTLTDEEKQEMRSSDPRARELLDRVERLGERDLMRLHGALRQLAPAPRRQQLGPGHRVRLRPRKGGDVLDVALAGEVATIESIEQDVGGRTYYTVTVDADPGRDLGRAAQPGHRFFFEPDEVEALE